MDDKPPPRWPEWRPRPADAALATAFAVVLVLGTLGSQRVPINHARPLDLAGGALIVLAAGASVLPRRGAPMAALVGTMAAVSAYLLAGYPYGPVQLCMIIAMYHVARYRALRHSLVACGVAAVLASATVLPRLVERFGSPVLLAVAWMGWIVLPWSIGALLHVVTAGRERARRELVARVALEERMKIAAEVHDIAGHGFAVIAMQAGLALLVFDEHPGQARESMEAIQATSAKSLTELRGMLDAFHRSGAPDGAGDDGGYDGNGDDGGHDAPVEKGLAAVGALVDQVRAGGLPVRLEMENMRTTGDPAGELPPDIDTVAYRVVQESLTNVLRHAGPAEADVTIGRDGGDLLVRVADTGTGHTGDPPGEGRGLAGMRERVEAAGGTFAAGPRTEGGFGVTARLPLGGDR